MTAEQLDPLRNWWQELSFAGKEHYRLDDEGNITLAISGMAEVPVGNVAEENRDALLKQLQDQFDAALAKVTELEVEWLAAEDKLKLADKVEHLKEHLAHTRMVGDVIRLIRIVDTWETDLKQLTEEHYQERLKIVEAAEALADSTDWKETANQFKELVEKWKHSGYLDKHRSDKLWHRLEAARTRFMERKRVHQDDEERDLLVALDLKIELAEQAEKLAMSETWKSTTEEFQKIVEKWKTLGRTLPKKNEELWQRIMKARSAFFDRKQEHYNKVQAEQEANYATKLALVEKAEALRESTEWAKTAQAFAQLMEEWKKTGRIPQDRGDELWKRFLAAQDQFFTAKHKHTDDTRASLVANYEVKQGLLRRAEQLKNSSRWGEVTGELNQLMEEWKKTGPVPREHSDRIWNEFIAARKHFFARKDENKVFRKEQAIANRSARVEQAHNLVRKVRQEITDEEEKILDFNNALENITPGKKAEELREHLEVLIGDSNARLKRLREKLAAAEEELKGVNESEGRHHSGKGDKKQEAEN